MSIEDDCDRLDIIRTLAGITSDDITVYHSRGSFEAIFDNEYLESQGFEGPAIEGTLPLLTARTIDVKDLPRGTRLTIGSESFTIERHEPDGTGMSRVYLKL